MQRSSREWSKEAVIQVDEALSGLGLGADAVKHGRAWKLVAESRLANVHHQLSLSAFVFSGSGRPEELQRRQTLKRHEGCDAGLSTSRAGRYSDFMSVHANEVTACDGTRSS